MQRNLRTIRKALFFLKIENTAIISSLPLQNTLFFYFLTFHKDKIPVTKVLF
jgi:hypothetical protein